MFRTAINSGCLIAVKLLHKVQAPKPDNWSLGDAESIEMAQYMIDKGLTINTPDKYNHMPLEKLASSGKVELIKYLVENLDADLNQKSPTKNLSLLEIAKRERDDLEASWPYNFSEDKAALEKTISYLKNH